MHVLISTVLLAHMHTCTHTTHTRTHTLRTPQALLYYGGMLAYFWLLATPAVGLVFGTYLFMSVTYAGVHYDEAFSSLRVPHYKSMTRMHITRWVWV
jgi:hypothetical protein